MGLIRKTASIATLGVVSFRSKKERLRRAESAYRKAADELAREQAARSEADRRVQAAERRAGQAELTAVHEAKSAARARRKVRGRKARRKEVVENRVGGLLESAQPAVAATAEKVGRRGRAAARKAEKMARRTATKARKEAAKAREEVGEARKDVHPKLRSAAVAAGDLADKAAATAGDLADKAKGKLPH